MRKSRDRPRPPALIFCLLATAGLLFFPAHTLRASSVDAERSSVRPYDGRTKPVGAPRIVYAVWYVVPPGSLAKRRARGQEFTAAHNHLPIGSLVSVTHLKNGRNVTVRITDRGVRNTRAKIDVCKEAAEKLDMIDEGIARVRLEVLEKDPQSGPGDDRATGARP